MHISSPAFDQGQPIPARYAFGQLAEGAPMAFSDNRNPPLQWSEVPPGTQSLVLLCIDDDVPAVKAQVNQPDCEIAADDPRQDFVHWVLIDLAADLRHIDDGSCASGVRNGGKQQPSGPLGSRQGINDYTSFMGDGDYYGYDGPCPPWNDLRLHHYHFRLYALDLAKLPIAEKRFSAADVLQAMEGHVLGQAELTGTYSLNRKVLGEG